ncbi:probable G-protein coupled receptor 146 [Narcine bancroftii]|uniref:probable G-protein coupled receptor 146 n=1 Tax=Narcine bancroftii TaxID=1343680 RepID=UPI003831893B
MWSCIQANFGPNATLCGDGLCQDVGMILSFASVAYLIVCFPLGLVFNGLVLIVNLRHKVSINMSDVYFTNMALAGLILNLVALLQLLGPDHLLWPVWAFGQEVCMGSFILFNVAALVSIYSATLLSLDCFIEQALPRTYMSSVYKTKLVCSFVWGGATLASFSSLLFYICSKISDQDRDCSQLQAKELGDAIMFFTGFLVPAAGVGCALCLIWRKLQPPWRTQASRLGPSVQRLLLATVLVQFGLWLPYHLTLLASTAHFVTRAEGSSLLANRTHFLRGSCELLAYLSTCAVPLLYKYLQKTFDTRLKLVIQDVRCGINGRVCIQDGMRQQNILTISGTETLPE